MPRKRRPLLDRFFDFFSYGEPDACWEWQGTRHRFGHGRLFVTGERRYISAHRMSYEVHVGPIPHGLIVRHTCDNPPCVNPAHLLTGTLADNVRDREERHRVVKRRGGAIRVSDEQVREIRKLRADGQLLCVLAAKFCISEANVSLIARRKSRGDVI